jgi:hypothetical protein
MESPPDRLDPSQASCSELMVADVESVSATLFDEPLYVAVSDPLMLLLTVTVLILKVPVVEPP